MAEMFEGVTVVACARNEVHTDEVNRRELKRQNKKILIIELLYEYAKNSTLHGLRYIVEKGLHVIERCFWFLTFFMSLAMCFFLIINVYIKWRDSPVLVSFNEKFVSVENVPFPSVTICPELKSKVSVYNYSEEFDLYDKDNINFPTDRLNKLSHVDTVCDFMAAITTGQNSTNSSLVEHITEVAPTAEDVFWFCDWQGEYLSCDDAFKPVLTKKGICYNFNALAADEILRTENLQKNYSYLSTEQKSTGWTQTEGYTNSSNEVYPKRGRDNADKPILTVYLTESNEDHDKLCNILKSGYTIFIQNPMDLPQASVYYYAALHGQLTSLAVKFDVLSTADSLKKYSAEARQCYFPGEKYLRYFRIYTFNNCRLECQSNFTFHHCNCVSFHMPSYCLVADTDSEHICQYENSFCVQDALGFMSLDNQSSCQCLPLCDSVQYDAEVLKTNLDINAYLKYYVNKKDSLNDTDFDDDDKLLRKKYSGIEIYYKEPRFISMQRSELFGVTDFLANCGGLLGLFLGFSFLSLVEIFYFGTLRLFCRLKKESREEEKKLEHEKDY